MDTPIAPLLRRRSYGVVRFACQPTRSDRGEFYQARDRRSHKAQKVPIVPWKPNTLQRGPAPPVYLRRSCANQTWFDSDRTRPLTATASDTANGCSCTFSGHTRPFRQSLPLALSWRPPSSDMNGIKSRYHSMAMAAGDCP
jgi:hypothetical protein